MKINYSKLIATVLILLLISPLSVKATNYTINFTGSGTATTVDNIVVQNLTKGTTVTVPGGKALLLSDVLSDVKAISQNDQGLMLKPGSVSGQYTISFFAPNAGNTKVCAYSTNGTKVCEIAQQLQIGYNSFVIDLSQGIFLIKVYGNGYTYSGKLQSLSGNRNVNSQVSYTGVAPKQNDVQQKVNSTVINYVQLYFTVGDLILYKGKSGNFTTIVTDIPSANKTVDFNFVECKDANGNYYPVVKIGNQTWMAENLKANALRNNENLNSLNLATDWSGSTSGACSDYNNDVNNTSTYGKLYNWYAVTDSRNIAPVGWKVPNDADWTTLTATLSGESVSGDKMKESSINFWGLSNTGTNLSGFTALPTGYRLSSGLFNYMGSYACWWTATEGTSNTKGYYRLISSSAVSVSRNEYSKTGGFAVRCLKSTIPTLTTNAATNLMSKSLVSGGSISDNGGEAVTEYGICWNTVGSPTISDSKTAVGNGTSAFSGAVSGLTPNTKYYIRAYATNSIGIAYGNEVSVTTPLTDPIVDIDGNIYHSVTIGTQTWMVENLKTTKYRNGDLIGTTSYLYQDLTYVDSPKYQWAYDGNESNVSLYGRLYTWYAVKDSRNIAPLGWHVASDVEWLALQNYLIANGYNYDKTTVDNKIAKALCANSLWSTSTYVGTPGYDMTQNNASGFSMVGNGYHGVDGSFYIMGAVSDTWTSGEASSTTGYAVGCGYNTVTLNSFSLNKKYGFAVRCIKNTVPTVTTSAASSVLATSAVLGGNVTADGGDAVTDYGVCWSTSANPTTANSKLSVGSGTGVFSTAITGLTPTTTYYARAYVTNSVGTSYGDQISFTTTSTVTDVDGNVYNTVVIGTQTWLVENLKTTKYNDGTSISYVSYDSDWTLMTNGGYGWPNASIANKDSYGAIYNWYAVGTGKLAPTGWHVATSTDVTTLLTYLGGGTVAGGKLKETGTTHWIYGNTGATNTSGFTALPGGYRSSATGNFQKFGYLSVFWTATEAAGTSTAGRLIMDNTSTNADLSNDNKLMGFNVRCIKNTLPTVTTSAASSVLATSAVLGGNVTSDGGDAVTDYGICWNTTGNPTVGDSKKSIGSGTGLFSSTITSLSPVVSYYVRSYATNSLGTSYGSQIIVTTQLP